MKHFAPIVAILIAIAAAVAALTHSGPAGARGAVGRVGPAGKAANVAELQQQVDKLKAYNAQLVTCLPELTDYVNGARVETDGDSEGYLWSAYLEYGSQVDRHCSKFLGFTQPQAD